MTTDPSRPTRDIQAPPGPAPYQVTRQLGPNWIKALLVFVSVLVLLVSGLGYVLVGRLGSEVASASNLSLNDREGGAEVRDGATDILLVGTDSRTDAQGNPLSEEELARLNAGVDDGEENTDTMMVVRVPEDGSRATAVSIPRDTYVSDDDFGNMKVNGVFASHKMERRDELLAEAQRGDGQLSDSEERNIEQAATEAGRQGLLEAVGDLTGVDIDHYAEVGLHGFVLLTNAIGGVEVCLNNPVDDPFSGAQFPAGRQTLDGLESLSFVRQRYGLPRGDLDRIVRQQAYMASLVNKVLSADVLTNPAKLSSMANAVERSVVIDEDWDVMSFATQLANLAGGNVIFTTIPVTSVDGVGDYGESIITVDVDEVHDFMESLSVSQTEEAPEGGEGADDADQEDGEAAAGPDSELADVQVHVLNAGGVAGLAGEVGAWLEGQGLSVPETTNAQPGVYYTSQVVAADPDSPAALALAEKLGGLPVTANAGLDDGLLIVVAADDYLGPSAEVAEDSAAADTSTEAPVGTPGADFGQTEDAPELDAGGDGPRCVN